MDSHRRWSRSWGPCQLRLGQAFEANGQAAEAVKVFTTLAAEINSEEEVYLARFLSSYSKLYGGQEATAVRELEAIASELALAEAPELEEIARAAHEQLRIAQSWEHLE